MSKVRVEAHHLTGGTMIQVVKIQYATRCAALLELMFYAEGEFVIPEKKFGKLISANIPVENYLVGHINIRSDGKFFLKSVGDVFGERNFFVVKTADADTTKIKEVSLEVLQAAYTTFLRSRIVEKLDI